MLKFMTKKKKTKKIITIIIFKDFLYLVLCKSKRKKQKQFSQGKIMVIKTELTLKHFDV